MHTLKLVHKLVHNDTRLIFRDQLILMLFAVAILSGLAARYALPAIDNSLFANGIMTGAKGGLRFADTYPLWVTYFGLWNSSQLPGTAFAFLLLGEKEDQTLLAMRVTPVPFAHYMGYRVAMPTLMALIFITLVIPIIGLSPIPLPHQFAIALGASLTAPIITLLLAMFSDNKVQGFAYTKFTGVAGLILLVGWFIPEPWQWALGLFPPYLIIKSYWMVLDHQSLWWLPLSAGTLLQTGLLAILIRRAQATTLR
ncbi:MAG: hypothetical protein AAFS10_00515 [Myxococcota bacterium]